MSKRDGHLLKAIGFLALALLCFGSVFMAHADPAGTPRSRSATVTSTTTSTFAFDGGPLTATTITGTGALTAATVASAFYDGGTAGVRITGPFVSTAAIGVIAFQCTTTGCIFAMDGTAGANMRAASEGPAFYSSSTKIGSWNTGTGDYVHPIGFINNTDASAGGGYRLASKMMAVGTAPTISSGFGASASIAANNGTIAFTVNVGTGGTASTGVIGLTACTTGWVCHCDDLAAAVGLTETRQSASTTTSCTVANVNTATGVAAAWGVSEVLYCSAHPI